MISLPKKSANTVQTNDDSNSLQDSRKSFKRLQRSSSKNSSRSYSRQSNTSLLSNFYVKNIYNKQQQTQFKCKVNQEVLAKKKRQPTPCKTKKQIPIYQNAELNNQTIQQQRSQLLQKNIKISNLQQKISQKQLISTKLQKKLQTKQSQIKKLQLKIKQFQQQCKKLQFENKQAQLKIQTLQQTILQNQQNLAFTNSTLQKLKKSINQNRFSDIKRQADKCKKKFTELNNSYQILVNQMQKKNLRILQLEKQVKGFKESARIESFKNQSMKQVNRLKQLLAVSTNALEKQMRDSLKKQENQNILLKNQNKKLLIQLDYIHRKHLQQLKLLYKTKADEITKYKNKYKALKIQYTQKQKQWQHKFKLYQKLHNQVNQCEKKSSNSFLSVNVHSQKLTIQQYKKLSISFQLSSDND